MSARQGLFGALYIGTAGAEPTTLVDGVGDVELQIKWDKAEIKRRRTRAKRYVLTQYDASIPIEFDDDSTDTALTTLVNAARNGTPISVKVLSAAGARGWKSDCVVEEDTENQKLSEVIHHKFTIVPTEGTLAPTFI